MRRFKIFLTSLFLTLVAFPVFAEGGGGDSGDGDALSFFGGLFIGLIALCVACIIGLVLLALLAFAFMWVWDKACAFRLENHF